MISEQKSEHTTNTAPGRFPSWLKRPIAHCGKQKDVLEKIHNSGLHTVCVEARCPNRSECYNLGTATFLILGTTCTRFCTFCSVNHGIPGPPDPDEPGKLVSAVSSLKLRHVVITSVTRDDLPDGGASVYADIITRLKKEIPGITVEVLIPDFKGDKDALLTVFEAKPDIFNHNVETVPRLYNQIRPQAIYQRSLDVLKYASEYGLVVKSGIMAGLGEQDEEVFGVMQNLLDHGCSIMTIGQYLRPSRSQTPVVAHVSPDKFSEYEKKGIDLGFRTVFAGPYVRSSYMAEQILNRTKSGCS
ncbi:MAG: lipoyl synthase [Fibrobacter sp.]|nr:lipoyl synthase [Fibrobacter sp.]